MKRNTGLALLLALLMLLTACGENTGSSTAAPTEAPALSTEAETTTEAETEATTEEPTTEAPTKEYAKRQVKLSGSELLPFVFGYLTTAKDNSNYVTFYRFTEKQRQQLLADGKTFVANTGAGIRLDIVGGFEHIKIKYRFGTGVSSQSQSFDVYENGVKTKNVTVPKAKYTSTVEDVLDYQMTKPGRFTLWFPTYASFAIAEIETDAEFEAAPQGVKVLVHGDSVTQGAFTEQVSEGYIAVMAREFGWDLLNQACSSYTFKKYPRDSFDFEPEIILVDYGYNDFNAGDVIDAEAGKFLQEIKDRYPKAQVFVISPAVRRYLKNESDQMMRLKLNKNNVSYQACCDTIEQHAAALGFTFMKSYNAQRSPIMIQDSVHPTKDGHVLLGKDLAEQLKEMLAP